MELLFDIGGTNSRIGVSEDGTSITRHEIVKTPTDFMEAIDLLSKRANALARGDKFDIAVMGLAAPINPERTQTVNTGGIRSWFGKPLKSLLEKKFGVPTYLENDAIMAALGEASFGAGRGYEIVGYLTFSTGVGGAKVVNGQVDPRRIGFEPAFMITHANSNNEAESKDDEIGRRLDGKFIEETFGQKPEDIKDPKFWEGIKRLMAITINNSIVMWSPDVIVIGGGMTKSIRIEEVIAATKRIFRAFPELPDIKLAKLGDIGGLYGALQLANTIKSHS